MLAKGKNPFMPNKNKSKLPDPTGGSTPADVDSVEPSVPSEVEILPPEAQQKLKELGIDLDDPKFRRVLGVFLEAYSGPIPPPSMLAQYEKVRPGIVDKIIDWNDRQMLHRHTLEKESSNRSEDRMDRGQWLAGGAMIFGLIIAGLVGVYGNGWVASVIAIVAVGGPTAAVALTRHLGRGR